MNAVWKALLKTVCRADDRSVYGFLETGVIVERENSFTKVLQSALNN